MGKCKEVEREGGREGGERERQIEGIRVRGKEGRRE